MPCHRLRVYPSLSFVPLPYSRYSPNSLFGSSSLLPPRYAVFTIPYRRFSTSSPLYPVFFRLSTKNNGTHVAGCLLPHAVRRFYRFYYQRLSLSSPTFISLLSPVPLSLILTRNFNSISRPSNNFHRDPPSFSEKATITFPRHRSPISARYFSLFFRN